MELTPFNVYCVLQLDTLRVGVHAALVIFCCIAAISASYAYLNDEWAALKTLRIIGVFALIPLMLLSMFLPSTKTAASMFMLPAVFNNEQIQKIPVELLELLRDQISGLKNSSDGK